MFIANFSAYMSSNYTGYPQKFARIRRTQNPYSGYIYLMCKVFAHRIFVLELKTAYYTCIVWSHEKKDSRVELFIILRKKKTTLQ